MVSVIGETRKPIRVRLPLTSITFVSGKRTLMGFLVSPITDTMEHAFHEQ